MSKRDPAARSHSFGPHKVLIVDDEPVVREVLARLLEQPGREFVSVESVEQAIAAARSEAFSLALVDKNLNTASGLALCRTLRTEHPDLEIILMTGYASLESAIEAVQLGAFDYLVKPFEDYGALTLKVQNAVEKSVLRRQQRELVAQLQESELRYRRLFESTPDALLVLDATSGLFEDANPAALELYGYAPKELISMQLHDVRRPESPSGDRVQRHRKKDGTWFSAEVTQSSFNLRGRLLRTLSVRDVSARERAEKEQRALEERLRASQKMEAIGRLAGGVAHDFNNLLAVVQAHAEFLGDALPSGEPVREEVEGIFQAASRGAALTRQLLLFGRQKAAEHGVVSWNAVVSDVQRLLLRVLGVQVRIHVALEPALWPVQADPDQLGQVLMNLAINARDAMPQGGEIAVTTANVHLERPLVFREGELPPGRYVRLSVRDTGVGMKPQIISRLFEPFFTTKETGKGTGLGLATCYGIVRATGGAMEVESAPGEGSSFHVWLPACEAARADEEPAPARGQRGRGETVLLVESEAPLRRLLRRMLAANGYRVLEASDGHSAIEAARAHDGPLHLVVADSVIHDLGATELALRLRASRSGLRFLFMAGSTETPESGPDCGSIQKPFSNAALLERIRSLLDTVSRGTKAEARPDGRS